MLTEFQKDSNYLRVENAELGKIYQEKRTLLLREREEQIKPIKKE